LPAAREHFIRWYCEHARAWLSSRVAEYQSRMEVSPAGVRMIGVPWGQTPPDALRAAGAERVSTRAEGLVVLAREAGEEAIEDERT